MPVPVPAASNIKKVVRWTYRGLRNRRHEAVKWSREKAARKALARYTAPLKLNIGCGSVRFDKWVNVDIASTAADVIWDATERFPLEDECCALIYSEHFLEHLNVEQGLRFLSECNRLLQTGGVLRIAMPSLDYLIDRYTRGDWRNQEWLKLPEYGSIATKAEMLNVAFRWWGHQWLYDREELRRRIQEAGFSTVTGKEWGASDEPDLRGRETRPDSLLICEAVKSSSNE
jgi:predicted SAM-dependent methyltransferase